jgi:protein-S-isoprenylcysteine O-methyltransferase Ste14
LIYSAAAVLVGGLGFWFWPADKPGAAATATTVNVPELTGLSAFGKAAFDKVCAACHGANGAGTDKGPPFVHIRHPQYAGFVLIMFGFLLQWPTLLTLAMFPVLVWMYVHLARQEEREARAQFGQAYEAYARRVPAFWPRIVGQPGQVPR